MSRRIIEFTLHMHNNLDYYMDSHSIIVTKNNVCVHRVRACHLYLRGAPHLPPLLRLRDPRSAEAETELTQTRCWDSRQPALASRAHTLTLTASLSTVHNLCNCVVIATSHGDTWLMEATDEQDFARLYNRNKSDNKRCWEIRRNEV